ARAGIGDLRVVPRRGRARQLGHRARPALVDRAGARPRRGVPARLLAAAIRTALRRACASRSARRRRRVLRVPNSRLAPRTAGGVVRAALGLRRLDHPCGNRRRLCRAGPARPPRRRRGVRARRRAVRRLAVIAPPHDAERLRRAGDRRRLRDGDRPLMTEMRLYDLRVTVERIEGRSVCGLEIGDYFEVTESNRVRIPPGKHFCLYALQSVLPLLPAKQRKLPDEDWLEQDTLVCCPDPDERVVMRIDRLGERIMQTEDLT